MFSPRRQQEAQEGKSMARLRLNQAWIDALKPHKSAYDVRDRDLNVLGVRVLPSDAKRCFNHREWTAATAKALAAGHSSTAKANAPPVSGSALASTRRRAPSASASTRRGPRRGPFHLRSNLVSVVGAFVLSERGWRSAGGRPSRVFVARHGRRRATPFATPPVPQPRLSRTDTGAYREG